MIWNDETIAKVKWLAGMNLTAAEIASRFGNDCTRCMVIGKLRRLRVPLSSQTPYSRMARLRKQYTVEWTDEKDAQLQRMFFAGTTLRNMATAFNCDDDAVKVRLEKFNLSIRDRMAEKARQQAKSSIWKPKAAPASAPLKLKRLSSSATPTPEECFRSPVSLLDAGRFQCRWIEGDPRQGAKCCGAPIISKLAFPKRSYCEHHTLRTVSKFEPAQEAKERERRRNQARQISVGEARVFA